MGGNIVHDGPWVNPAGPAHEDWHAPATLPIGVLLAAERGDTGIRPAVIMRAVISRIHHDRVVRDAKLVELGQHSSNVLVMGDHYIIVVALPALAGVLLGS